MAGLYVTRMELCLRSGLHPGLDRCVQFRALFSRVPGRAAPADAAGDGGYGQVFVYGARARSDRKWFLSLLVCFSDYL